MAATRKAKQALTDIRKQTDDDLVTEVYALREKLFKLRGQAVTDKIDDNSAFRKIRQEIARVLSEQAARRHKANPKPRKPVAVAKVNPPRARAKVAK